MKVAFLLIIVLSNEGHWLSGSEGRVTAQWAAEAAAAPAELAWELKLGDVRIGEGRVAIEPQTRGVVKIICPEVRARVRLQWEWRLIGKGDGKELAAGTQTIVAYPPAAEMMRGWTALLAGKRVVVVDRPSALPATLEPAKLRFERLDDVARLERVSADIVLVGEDAIGESPFEQAGLAALNASGTAVAVFRQSRPRGVLGFELVAREPAARFDWRTSDPLLQRLDSEDLQSWERSWAREAGRIHAIRVPRAATERTTRTVIAWPSDVRSGTGTAALREAAAAAATQPAAGSVDALLAWRCDGGRAAGRAVLCQMPLGDCKSDPRSLLLLGNVLDALVSPPMPPTRTESPPAAAPATGKPEATIKLSPGDSR